MTERREHHDRKRRFSVSPGFAEDLDKLWRPEGQVPAAVDRAIAEAARRHFAHCPRRIRLPRWGIPAAAAAAAIIVVALCSWRHEPAGNRSATQSERSTYRTVAHRQTDDAAIAAIDVRADIDRNGRVDILDALTMARHMEAGHPTTNLWDVDGDGFVNSNDIDAVAYEAVRLDKGVGS